MSNKQSKTLMEKFAETLQGLGLSSRKAQETAKALVPVARRGVKAEITRKERAAAPVEVPVSARQQAQAAPQGEILPVTGGKGADLLQTIMGLTSGPSYKVVAVKGEDQIVAAKRFGFTFKLKFYPTMEAWGFNFERLQTLGATDHLSRHEYERAMFPESAVQEVLKRINIEAGSKKKRSFKDRMKAVAYAALQKAIALAA